MIPLKKALTSSVGQKFVMGLSGLGLVVYMIIHLAGNLILYKRDPEFFNHYAANLESFGPFLTVIEIALFTVFLVHIYMGIRLKTQNVAARPVGYRMWRSKAGSVPTEQAPSNGSSRRMIISGVVLLAFLFIHVWQFRWSTTVDAGYVTELKGEKVHDLYRVALETFSNPVYVAIYMGSMLFLGWHLRHGFWSAFQSLGANNPRISRPIYCLGVLIAVVMTLGFFFIPLYVYLGAH